MTINSAEKTVDYWSLYEIATAVHDAIGDAQFKVEPLVRLAKLLRRAAPRRGGGIDEKALTEWLERHRGVAANERVLLRSANGTRWMAAPAMNMKLDADLEDFRLAREAEQKAHGMAPARSASDVALDPELDALLSDTPVNGQRFH